MADTNFRRFYRPADFAALTGNLDIGLLRTALTALVLSTPIGNVELLAPGLGVRLEWDTLPSAADITAINAAVASFVGGTTTSSPFEYNSFAASTSTVGTPTTKLDNTTPPLDAGTYQVLWTTSLRMLAVIANTGIQADITLTRSDGAAVRQDDSWDLNVRHAFNGAITFQVAAGQTLRSLLTFQRLGASGTAELSGARITVDKIS